MASAYFKLKLLKKKRIAARRKCVSNKLSLNIKNSENVATTIKKCRVCLEVGHIPIYGNDSFTECPEYIRKFGDIELSDNDEFPKYMCTACHTLLQNAISFRKKAKYSDVILRQTSNPQQIDDSELNEDSCIDRSSVYNEKFSLESSKTYLCQPCNLNCESWTEYVDHKNSKQHKKVRIQCPICLGLLTSQLYKKHLARHQSESHLICEVCGKLYRKDNLIRHLQLHNFDLPYQCQLCPYRGRFVDSLTIHMRTHTGDKPFSCDNCQLRFLTRSNLNRHLLTHKKDKPFKCLECGRGFYVKRDLDVHFKADHAGIKDFGCNLCGNKYGTKRALMRHELRVHKRDKFAKGRKPLYLQDDYRNKLESECVVVKK